MLNFIGNAYRVVRDFFVVSWEYLKRSNATFNSLGDDLITSAQNDLLNLKNKLERLWEIQEQDRETAALYLAAVLGKFGFTFIIIGVSLLASLSKLSFGSFCLFLAGRWLSLISKLFNICRKILSYSLIFLRDGLSKILTNAFQLISNVARKFAEYARKFINASLDFLRAAISYVKPVWKMLLNFVSTACRNFVGIAKWIGNKILDVWQTVLDFAAATWRAIKRFAINFVQNVGNAVVHCFEGIGHLVLGILKAGTITVKGVALSVAALFIETGLANSLSGVAKTMFILEESLAAGVGTLMDGVYASGNSFLKSVKSIFGYGDTVPTTDSMHINNDIAIASELGASTYYSRKARDNAHYVNEYFASAGNKMLSVYQKQKEQMIGASGWSDVADITENEIVRSLSTHRASV